MSCWVDFQGFRKTISVGYAVTGLFGMCCHFGRVRFVSALQSGIQIAQLWCNVWCRMAGVVLLHVDVFVSCVIVN